MNLSEIKIAVIGLGYVGLPLARLFSTKYKTVGFDMNAARCAALMAGHDATLEVRDELLQDAIHNHGFICTADIEAIRDCKFYVVAVPTPVDENHTPDLTPLYGASETVGKVISRGDIVVYESTVYPGVTEDECLPVVERVSGLKFNTDFFVKNNVKLLVTIGGDDTASTANRISKFLAANNVKIQNIHVPKTIDNDLAGTDHCPGYASAAKYIAVTTQEIIRDCAVYQVPAVTIIEIMGRDAGWIALHSAIAGGADVCLIPEIPYDIEKVREKIEARYTNRRGFCNIVIAEGAKPIGGEVVGKASTEVGYQHIRLGGVAEKLAADLKNIGVEHDIRYTLLGHLQRGGIPTAYDRILATEFGVRAFEFVKEGRFGEMVAYRHPEIIGVHLAEAVSKPNLVTPDNRLLHTAKGLGIVFGD